MTPRSFPSSSRLRDIVSGFRDLPVAVLGDLVVDEFVHGDIARVSREAPVLILEQSRVEYLPGGGGNAVANLRSLGARPIPVGIVGRDEAGRRLIALFRQLGVATRGIAVESAYETPTKSRILAGGVHTRRQQIVRVDRGARHGELSLALAEPLAARLAREIGGAKGLLVADYGYGAAAPALLRKTRGALARKLVTVDSRGRVGAFRKAAGCTPNQEELEIAVGLERGADERTLVSAAAALLKTTGNRTVLVTRGAKGMVLVRPDAPPLTVPPFGTGEVADVTGAGDTVIATYTLGLLAGGSPEEAAVLANIAAGIVVMKYGTATVGPAELIAAIRDGQAS